MNYKQKFFLITGGLVLFWLALGTTLYFLGRPLFIQYLALVFIWGMHEYTHRVVLEPNAERIGYCRGRIDGRNMCKNE